MGILGNPITEGGKVFFEALNAKGGVAGKYKVEVVVEDSAYDNNIGITKYEKIKGDVVMLAQLLGTGVTQAVLPKLRADKMVAAPASLDAEWQAEENLLPVGGPYQIEFINAAHYYVTEGGGKGKNICMLAINIPYGQAGVEGLQAAAKAEGFEIKATARYEAADQEFTAQVTQLKNAKCDAVFFTALPSNTGPILGTAAKLGFTPQWFGQAPTFVTAQAASPQLAPILEKTFLLASEGPTWGDESIAGHEADAGRHRPVPAGPGAGLLLHLRLHPGQGVGRPAREGRGEGRPLPPGHPRRRWANSAWSTSAVCSARPPTARRPTGTRPGRRPSSRSTPASPAPSKR